MAFSAETEMKIHAWFKRELLKRYPKAYTFKPSGGPYGKKGTHDYIFCIDGLFFSVEIKKENGSVTALQEKTMRDVHAAGGFSAVLRGRSTVVFDLIAEWIAFKEQK
jgi:hypothetical protein